jgi:hypothetical protein
MLEACQWIQDTWLSVALRESTWGYPIVGALHVLALAWFGSGVLLTNLRLLGWTMRGVPARDVGAWLRPWNRIGLAALILTGGLLFWLEPVRCYSSAAFRAKLALIFIALLITPARKRTAALSLALWFGVILAARLIAYF